MFWSYELNALFVQCTFNHHYMAYVHDLTCNKHAFVSQLLGLMFSYKD